MNKKAYRKDDEELICFLTYLSFLLCLEHYAKRHTEGNERKLLTAW